MVYLLLNLTALAACAARLSRTPFLMWRNRGENGQGPVLCILNVGGILRVWLAQGKVSMKCILKVDCPDLCLSLHSNKSYQQMTASSNACIICWLIMHTNSFSYVIHCATYSGRFYLVWEAAWAGLTALWKINSWQQNLSFHCSLCKSDQ